MKTAISIPEATFERATHKARALGMSRSEFFTRAATRNLEELDASSVTEQINHALASLDGDDDSTRDAVSVGRRVLAAAITSNTRLAAMPGNVFLPASATGLPDDSVLDVTALVTLDKDGLGDSAGTVPPTMEDVERGLRRVVAL